MTSRAFAWTHLRIHHVIPVFQITLPHLFNMFIGNCCRLNCVSPPKKKYVDILTPGADEWDLIWKQGLGKCNQVKMRSYCLRVGPKANGQCPYKERDFRNRHRRDGHKEEDPGSRDWGDVAIIQGSKIAGHYQTEGETRKLLERA